MVEDSINLSVNIHNKVMAKYTVSRVRHVVEAIVVDATSSEDAVAKARKTLRKDWSHLESKKRKSYQAAKTVTE